MCNYTLNPSPRLESVFHFLTMLPLYDADLDTQAFNIFQPLPSILPYQLPKLTIATVEIQPTKPTKPTPLSFKKPEIDLYCKACKKKFSNEPTFTNHLKSAKHIANEKKMQPAKATPTQRIPVHPQVQDALGQIEQAQQNKCDPTTSVTIYWTQAQILFSLKRPQYVEKALTLLIQLLQSSPATTFSSAQITSFLYNSRLALARLLCIYQNLEESRSFYLDALDGKWKLEKIQLIQIAQSLPSLSITELLNTCDTLATKYLTRERTRTKPAPIISDMNNSITTILNEAGNLFAQEDTFNSIPSEYIAIVLYATCSLVCQYDKTNEFNSNDFYFMMNQVYESLDNLDHRIIELNLLDKSNTWNIFNALLLSIEIDDLVRSNHIYPLLKQENDAYLYPDVKLLCDICHCKLTLTYYNCEQDLNYIKLLLNGTDEPLLIRNRSEKEQMYTLDRITDLI